jgi:hypothetical protein
MDEGKGSMFYKAYPILFLWLVLLSISLSHDDLSSSKLTSLFLPIFRATCRKRTNSSVSAKRTDSATALKQLMKISAASCCF